MAEATDTFGILKQNLEDMGCGKEVTEECMELVHQERWKEVRKLLMKHKNKLLETLHMNQSQIDCLDYLVYKIDKEHK